MEGACSPQALQQDAFQKQQQIWKQKALRKMSNAGRKGRDFCGTRPKLQLFMKINWFGCYWACTENASVYEKSACPSLIAVPWEATQSLGCPLSLLQNLVSNHISLKTVFLQASTDIHSSEERLQAWFILISCHSSFTEVDEAAPAHTWNGSGSAVRKCWGLS